MHEVTGATVLSRLLYAAPAWRGFFLVHAKVRVDLVHAKVRVERFIAKSVRMGYLLPNNCDYEELVREAENGLL